MVMLRLQLGVGFGLLLGFMDFVDHADVEFQRVGEQSSKNSGVGMITVYVRRLSTP
jgi:hypothetical protein